MFDKFHNIESSEIVIKLVKFVFLLNSIIRIVFIVEKKIIIETAVCKFYTEMKKQKNFLF